MHRLRSGEKAAFRELFKRHGSFVYGYCMRVLAGDRAVVDDITQDVWLKVNEKCEQYQNRGNFRAWMMAIARNEIVNVYRKRARLSDFGEGQGEDDVPDTFNLEDTLAEKADETALKRAIDALPEAQRMALALWIEEGSTYEAIGAQMGCSAASVRGLLHRARSALKKSLGEEA